MVGGVAVAVGGAAVGQTGRYGPVPGAAIPSRECDNWSLSLNSFLDHYPVG